MSVPADRLPRLALSRSEARDLKHRETFGRYLAAADLGPLWCGPVPVEAYRLVWVPSYRPALVIEVVRGDAEWKVTVVEFRDPRHVASERQAAERTGVVSRRTFPAADEDLSIFLEVASHSAVWAEANDVDSRTEDGTMFGLEAKRKSEYQAQLRANSPSPESERLVRAFVQVAHLDWTAEVNRRE